MDRTIRSGSIRMVSQRDTEDDSPPRTPPSQSVRHNPSKRTLHARPSLRDAFPNEMASFDRANEGNHSGDEPDPHDLSLDPQHAARTSIVDNMLLSLDQFASSNSVLDDYRLFNSAFESGMYRNSQDSPAQTRNRGHTFSSSLSSEPDMGNESGRYQFQYPKARRSNSSSNYRPGMASAANARSRDGQRYHGTSRGSKSSASSNADFGNTFGRDRAGSDSGSASFDYGPRKTLAPFSEAPSDGESPFDTDDAAPTPNVPAGPRKPYTPNNGYSGIPSHQSSKTPVASRRNSIKSARSYHTKKSQQDMNGTRTTRSRGKDSRNDGGIGLDPPPPVPALDPPAPSPTISYNKPSLPPPEAAPAKERPGFFRRVFGSSKNLSPAPSDQKLPESPSLQTTDTRSSGASSVNPKGWRQPQKTNVASPDVPANEGQRQVVNKKSSFFRRRKKSVADSAPPPIVIPQDFNPRALEIKAEPSPVSSLRKVMNPYLADGSSAPHNDAREYPDNGANKENIGDQNTVRSQKQKRGSTLAAGSESRPANDRLHVPTSRGHDGPSLADSGPENTGTDDRLAGTNAGMQMQGPQHEHRAPAKEETKSHGVVAPQNNLTLTHTTAVGLSPVVEDFSQGNSPSEAQKPGLTESNGSGNLAPCQDHLDEPSKLSPTEINGGSPTASTSEHSNYFTASNTPVIPFEEPKSGETTELTAGTSDGAPVRRPTNEEREQAQRLFDSQDQVVGNEPAAAWLGDPDRAMIREAYMALFDWSKMNILEALRSLCTRLVLKGETQQVDRVLDAFSSRWCECNPRHGFKAADVVHTICYSLLLLNTDLHLADIEQKMTKSQFVRNTLPTIHRVAIDAFPDGFETVRPGNKSKARASVQSLNFVPPKSPAGSVDDPSREPLPDSTLAKFPIPPTRADSGDMTGDSNASVNPLVSVPFNGTIRAWEQQIESVLREFYTSIQKERLPLHGARQEKDMPRASSTNLLIPSSALRRTPSTISRSSDVYPRGRSADSRYGAARWSSKPRSRARLNPVSTMGSSRTSLDDQSSLWSPSASSTWSKHSFGKFTSASVDSFRSEYPRGGEYQQSIGFANALSQAIIREDAANSISSFDDSERMTPLLEDETLQLAGAPWAKEGSLKHKHHLDSVDKKAKDRNWNECFAVIQQGWMRLFSFSGSSRTARQKTKQQNVVVGGGNWLENAEEIWKFLLRQTIASGLPPPGYSKSRPHVWALSLPTGAVHLFQVGTPEIVREFVSTANYWSARLSKEPLVGGISNIEYGWGDAVINSALVHADHNKTPPSSAGRRPSLQSSIRSSIDQQTTRPRLPADRVNISDWKPPQQTMTASLLPEEEQLSALQNYVKNIENELQRHNELRPAMIIAFSPRHPNAAKAMANWERKSSYLLREIVKFRTYIDSLQAALVQKKKILASEEPSEEHVNGEPKEVQQPTNGEPTSISA